MRTLKKLMALVFVVTLGLLAGCDSAADKAAAAAAISGLQQEARQAGEAAERAKAEQRYLANKRAVEQVARDEVNKADLKHASGCKILPSDLVNLPAYKALEQTGKGVYVAACEKQIVANFAAEKDRARKEMLAEKERQRKIAAAKAKQEAKIAGLKACDTKFPPGKARTDCRAGVAKRYV